MHHIIAATLVILFAVIHKFILLGTTIESFKMKGQIHAMDDAFKFDGRDITSLDACIITGKTII